LEMLLNQTHVELLPLVPLDSLETPWTVFMHEGANTRPTFQNETKQKKNNNRFFFVDSCFCCWLLSQSRQNEQGMFVNAQKLTD
jgi:hypothetical protein